MCYRTRSGFTIVELLVVLAIIGILVAVLLPAVQGVREASRRTHCQNQLRQWALAMSMHHDVKGHLPYGSAQFPYEEGVTRTNPMLNRHGWPPQLWPYIEESALYESYNFKLGFYQEPNTILESLEGPTGHAVAIYYCPSDRGSPAYAKGDKWWRVRGSYAVNWGPAPFPPIQNFRAIRQEVAPFGFTNFVSRNRPRLTRYAAMTDGLSRTMLLGEKIMHPLDDATDHRGDMLNDDAGGGVFMTFDTPNSSNPDFLWPYRRSCHEVPQLPCADGTVWTGIRHAARSRHLGGVNVAMADGSVLFASDSIGLQVWQDLSTMNDEQTIELASAIH